MNESSSNKKMSRREMISRLAQIAATSALVGAGIRGLYDGLTSEYNILDERMKYADEMEFSQKARTFAISFYAKLIPDIEAQITESEDEIIKIFDNWFERGIQVKLNQKMYDALVLIMIRIGKMPFRLSKFIQEIKKTNNSEAVKHIVIEAKSKINLGEADAFIRKYELMLFSSFDIEIQKKFYLTRSEIRNRESLEEKKKDIVNKIISVARKYVGEEEIRGNRGFISKDFEAKMKKVGWNRGDAWCSYFVEMVISEAIGDTNIWNRCKKLFHGSTVATFTNFKLSPYFKVGKTPKVGSIVVWSYTLGKGHIGIVTSVQGENDFTTIEGNTTVFGSPEGTEVRIKNRRRNNVGLKLLGFIYLV